MVEIIIVLAVLTLLFWLGFHITGPLLSAAIWLFIKLPFALIVGCLGVACCVTILLIPLGGKCFNILLTSASARRSHSPARRQAGQLRHSAGTPAGACLKGWKRCQTSRVRPAADRPPPAWSFPDGRCTI